MRTLCTVTIGIFFLCLFTQTAFAQKKKKKDQRNITVPAIYKLDNDKDGVPDVRDQCPGTPVGQQVDEFGCPFDTDGDGIFDYQDKCPNEQGPKANQGCPWGDTDGDGFTDNIDKCPTVPGVEQYKGCPTPDRDNDGIEDNQDRCPDNPGPKELKGCPDTDNDGLVDIEDKCPKEPGPISNLGCPKIITHEEEQVLKQASKVNFEFNKAKILSSSHGILDKVVAILKKYPKSYLLIEGHTDSVGEDENNQALSENRAAAVREYLIQRGIDPERITSRGFGESRPVDTNDTDEGRANNRRVDMVISNNPPE